MNRERDFLSSSRLVKATLAFALSESFTRVFFARLRSELTLSRKHDGCLLLSINSPPKHFIFFVSLHLFIEPSGIVFLALSAIVDWHQSSSTTKTANAGG
jgi:hypothetical protein